MKGAIRSVQCPPSVLWLAMILTLIPGVAVRAQALEPELAVVGGTGAPGATVHVVIRLANDTAEAGVSADLDIEFPTDLVEIDLPIAQSCTVATRLATTHQVGGRIPQPGLLKFSLLARDLQISPVGDGDLATCDFHILPGAALRTAPLTVVFAGLFDANGQVVSSAGVDGAIVIRTSCPADCNGDGQVTIAELIRGVAVALGNVPLGECLALDSNGDGAVSINEIINGVNGAQRGCPS